MKSKSIDFMNNEVMRRLNDGRMNMKEPMQKGSSKKDGDGFYVSGVTSNYKNYKAPSNVQKVKKGGSC